MNKKALILTCLLISTFLTLQLPQALAQTTDVEVYALRGYPFKETLSAPNTPLHKVYIVVGFRNLGTVSTTCYVFIYDNMNLITVVIVNLAPNQNLWIRYETTTNALGKGQHALSTLVVVPGDPNPGNNYYVGNTIQIGIAGDVNLNGYVGIDDIVFVADRVNNTGTMSPQWVPEVDANLDGYIGGDDIVYFAKRGDLNSVTLAAHAFGSEGTHSNDLGLPFAWIYDQYRDGVINMQDVELVASLFGSSDP